MKTKSAFFPTIRQNFPCRKLSQTLQEIDCGHCIFFGCPLFRVRHIVSSIFVFKPSYCSLDFLSPESTSLHNFLFQSVFNFTVCPFSSSFFSISLFARCVILYFSLSFTLSPTHSLLRPRMLSIVLIRPQLSASSDPRTRCVFGGSG